MTRRRGSAIAQPFGCRPSVLPGRRADPPDTGMPMLAKLGARDRAQLVIVACETGLIRPS